MKNITFSIIIPLKKCNAYLKENITALLNGSCQDFEIIVLPDKKESITFPKTKIIPTGNVGPAEKRDKGAMLAKGKFLAFIDDDAFPSRDWLKNALPFFKFYDVAAVCGPGVTPPGDSIFQQVSGSFSASLLGGGPYIYRFIPQKEREVDDFPSMNLLVRKSDFLKVNGFDTNFWPGEDTKFCHDLVHTLRKKIIYHPSVLVYHHRRAIFTAHLQQNGRYGLHRGYFARILPKTSFRISYFLPAMLLLGVLFLPMLYYFNQPLFYIDLFFVLFYCFLVFLSSLENFTYEKKMGVALLLIPTTVVTHLFYGGKFLQGLLFTRSLRK